MDSRRVPKIATSEIRGQSEKQQGPIHLGYDVKPELTRYSPLHFRILFVMGIDLCNLRKT
jgi:hypothetical protein